MPDAKYEQKKDVTKRVRFYDGQFLQAQDFVDEQAYHLDRQRRHNRTLHVSGVVAGLEVSIESGEVRVAAGTAVDADGRQIVLPETKSKDLQDWSQDKYIYIAYRQTEDDEQQAEQGVSGYTRWLETPDIFFLDDKLAVGEIYSDAGAQEQYRPVCLGQIKKTNAGFEVTPEGRVYSGLRLPGPAAAAWRSDEQGRLSLWRTQDGVSKRQLTVTEEGLVGLGTDSPQAGLEINTSAGNVGLKVRGETHFEDEVVINTPAGQIRSSKLAGLQRIEGGRKYYNYNDIDDWKLSDGEGSRRYTDDIEFRESFVHRPEVLVSISAFDIYKEKNSRLTAHAPKEKITKAGFELAIDTWEDTRVYAVSVSWIAYGKIAEQN